MKLNKWIKPGSSEVRYYIDLKFGGSPFAPRSINQMMYGYWFQADSKGNVKAFHKGDRGQICTGENGKFILDFFGATGISFESFERRYEQSLTKGGNFSEVKYFKTIWPDWQSEAA